MDEHSTRGTALALLNELMDRIATLTQHSGLSVDDVQAAIADSFSRRPDGGRPYPVLTEVSREHRELGAIISLWRASADYTDDSGEPIAIPIHGRAPSLRALFEQVAARLPDMPLSFESATDHLLSYNSIEAVADGLVRPTATVVLVTRTGAANPLVQLSYLVDFSDTVVHNLEQQTNGNGNTLFQAVAEVPDVPVDQVRVINGAVVQDAYRFLEQVDAMIEQAAKMPTGDMGSRQRMGLGVYLFGRPAKLSGNSGT